MIDKTILKNCKRRHTNLAVAWIDYHKAYDMTPHSCITECLEMIGAASRIRSFVQKTTPLWRTKLIAGDSLSPLLFVICVIPVTLLLGSCKAGYHLGKESLKVNHLLFMDDLKLFGKSSKEIDSLIRTVFVFSQEIQIEFGVKKCGVVIIKRGKVVTSDGIQLPNGESIKTVDDEGYRYLGMLEIDQIMQQQMKVLIQKEYLRRTKKILKSKLNGKNIVLAINSWGVSLMRYEAGIINWTDEELKALHRKTHKKLTMYGALHPRSDVHPACCPIQTDNKPDHNRPDIVVVNKSRRSCLLVDIVCPFDTRIVKKEEQIDVYQDLRQELKRLWNLRELNIILVISGALGTIGINHRKWQDLIEINFSTHLLQKVTLLGTTRIIRKDLDTLRARDSS